MADNVRTQHEQEMTILRSRMEREILGPIFRAMAPGADPRWSWSDLAYIDPLKTGECSEFDRRGA